MHDDLKAVGTTNDLTVFFKPTLQRTFGEQSDGVRPSLRSHHRFFGSGVRVPAGTSVERFTSGF
jgi:hypothetical protein